MQFSFTTLFYLMELFESELAAVELGQARQDTRHCSLGQRGYQQEQEQEQEQEREWEREREREREQEQEQLNYKSDRSRRISMRRNKSRNMKEDWRTLPG